LVDGAAAGLVAALVSGIPSTIIDRRPVEAVRAAGTLLGRPTMIRGATAHLAISVGWGVVLARVLRRRPSLVAGAGAGLAIGALDLGVVGRRFPRIDALPKGPQLLDPAAFGATVAWWLQRHDRVSRITR